MKLICLTNQYPKTSHTFIRREIQALEEIGHEVLRMSIRRSQEAILSSDREEFEKTWVLLDETPLKLGLYCFLAMTRDPITWLLTLIGSWRLGGRFKWGLFKHTIYFVEACFLLRIARSMSIQHIHVHFGTNPATVALICRRLGGPPFSFTVHGPEEFDKALFISLDEKIKHARFVVAISEFGRGQLMRWCSFHDWHKIHVVKCGVDRAFVETIPTQVPDVHKLICVARLSTQKAIPLLLEVMSVLQSTRKDLVLEIVGDGPDRNEIETLIGQWSLRDNVQITGYLDDGEVRRRMESSRALVVPSLAEGLPVVIMEAFALARPVIASRVAGIPELVEDHVNGWLVSPGSVGELATVIQEMLDTPVNTLSQMGMNGCERVRIEHDSTLQARKLSRLLHGTDSPLSARSS